MPHIDFTNNASQFRPLNSSKLYATTEPENTNVADCQVTLNPKNQWQPVPCSGCPASLWHGGPIAVLSWVSSSASDTSPTGGGNITSTLAGDPATSVTFSEGQYYTFNESEIVRPKFQIPTSGDCVSYWLQTKQDFFNRSATEFPTYLGSRTQTGIAGGTFSDWDAPIPGGQNSVKTLVVGWNLRIIGGQITLKCDMDPNNSVGFIYRPARYYWFGRRTVTPSVGAPYFSYPDLTIGTPPGEGEGLTDGPATDWPPSISQTWKGGFTCDQLTNGSAISLEYDASASYGPKLSLPDILRINFTDLVD